MSGTAMFTVPRQSFGRSNATRRLALREAEEELRAKQREADFAAMAYSQSLAEQKAAHQAEVRCSSWMASLVCRFMPCRNLPSTLVHCCWLTTCTQ